MPAKITYPNTATLTFRPGRPPADPAGLKLYNRAEEIIDTAKRITDYLLDSDNTLFDVDDHAGCVAIHKSEAGEVSERDAPWLTSGYLNEHFMTASCATNPNSHGRRSTLVKRDNNIFVKRDSGLNSRAVGTVESLTFNPDGSMTIAQANEVSEHTTHGGPAGEINFPQATSFTFRPDDGPPADGSKVADYFRGKRLIEKAEQVKAHFNQADNGHSDVDGRAGYVDIHSEYAPGLMETGASYVNGKMGDQVLRATVSSSQGALGAESTIVMQDSYIFAKRDRAFNHQDSTSVESINFHPDGTVTYSRADDVNNRY